MADLGHEQCVKSAGKFTVFLKIVSIDICDVTIIAQSKNMVKA